MDAEIRPKPTSEERDAIVRVLEEQGASGAVPAAYRSDWRALGIRENLTDEEPEEPV